PYLLEDAAPPRQYALRPGRAANEQQARCREQPAAFLERAGEWQPCVRLAALALGLGHFEAKSIRGGRLTIFVHLPGFEVKAGSDVRNHDKGVGRQGEDGGDTLAQGVLKRLCVARADDAQYRAQRQRLSYQGSP